MELTFKRTSWPKKPGAYDDKIQEVRCQKIMKIAAEKRALELGIDMSKYIRRLIDADIKTGLSVKAKAANMDLAEYIRTLKA
jgi:hypothetical protein